MNAIGGTSPSPDRLPDNRPDELTFPDRAAVARAVERATRRYFTDRRARVDAFVDAHFSLRGSLALHRAALGWDILRAPANLFLGAPEVGLRLVQAAAGKLGARRAARALARRHLVLETKVAREIAWLVHTELLELPYAQDGRESHRDALAETILEDPEIRPALVQALEAIGRRAGDPGFRQRLEAALATYAGTRANAAEIATGLLTLGTGALAVHKLTPGAVTLGPTLAAVLAQQSAIAAFPLGSGLGTLWYSAFPVAPPLALVAGLTGGLMLAASTFAAFAGVITDPLQRRTGLHRRRLLRLLDALERQMTDDTAPAFAVRDHYVARLLDLFDVLGAAWRLAHP